MALNIPLSWGSCRCPPQGRFQRRLQFWNWNIHMNPSLSSLHSQSSSITSYATHIIFGNWKGLRSTGYVHYALIMNDESQLLSRSRSMNNTGIRSNTNPLTTVQQGKSLCTHMKSSMDENAKKL